MMRWNEPASLCPFGGACMAPKNGIPMNGQVGVSGENGFHWIYFCIQQQRQQRKNVIWDLLESFTYISQRLGISPFSSQTE